MAGQLKDRVVLITGGGSGFGRAAALQFCAEDARVAVGDINPDSAEATAQAVRDAGGEAWAGPVDVAEQGSVQKFFDAALKAFGRIDCAFNNAGILGPLGDLHAVSLADYERVMAVNVRGVWLCMQAEIACMLQQEAPAGGHSIVNTASVAGLVGSALLPAYAASKHAVVGLTRTAARSYGRRGIRVNCVCPGPIETPLAEPLFEQGNMRELMLARQALDRFGTPEEVAALVVWLSSPAAALITGTPVRVDAGALS
jgi:NAD(P)-dependent dehydrogenase (short-subunit alcohol dehydrogenase family)